MGFFPVDDATIDYFEGTGRTKAADPTRRRVLKAQDLARTAVRRSYPWS